MDLYDHNLHSTTQPASHYECSIDLRNDNNNLLNFVKQQAFTYMDRLEGWCTKNKAAILIEFVFRLQPKKVVEVGVFGGKSLVPMACALRATQSGKIYGIDPWESSESVDGMDGENFNWWNSIDHNSILRGLQDRIRDFELINEIILLKTTSEMAPLIYDIDILHIDGNHSEKASYYDVTKWVPLVRKGGIIVLDDITWGTTEKAVNWLDENCIKIAEFHESNDWGIWVKP